MLSREVLFSLIPISLTAVSTIAAFYAVDASVNDTALDLPFQNRAVTMSILPEGWAFFTRDAREPRMYFYIKGSDGRWEDATAKPLPSMANAFGLNRRPRRQGVEGALLTQEVARYQGGVETWPVCRPKEGWSVPPEDCLNAAPVLGQVKNISPVPTLCGDVVIVARKPVPFAWVRGRSMSRWKSFKVPVRTARLDIKC